MNIKTKGKIKKPQDFEAFDICFSLRIRIANQCN